MSCALLPIPAPSLVLLIGPSGSGKSTFAHRHFLSTEIVSSDHCRALITDDEADQGATPDAFELVFSIVARRLRHYRLTVVDATSLKAEDRRGLLALAQRANLPTAALVFDLPLEQVLEQAQGRTRAVPEEVIRVHQQQLQNTLRELPREGYRELHVLQSREALETAQVHRILLGPNAQHEQGPLDLIGDVHGCIEELLTLLTRLGYRIEQAGDEHEVVPPPGRRALFLGDLVDRGPGVVAVLRLVMRMVGQGRALCVLGNHEAKLLKHLQGRPVKETHGLDVTLKQLKETSSAFQASLRSFLEGLSPHLVLDGGRLVAAHAGMKESLQGRDLASSVSFGLYGETTGESDEYGLPVRLNWAAEYRGKARVIYGHTPILQPRWQNGTLCIDTGCVFGGALTALRYPELELVSVPALQVWCPPARPLKSSSGEEDIPQGAALQTRFGAGWVGSRRHGQEALAHWESVTRSRQGVPAGAWLGVLGMPAPVPYSRRPGVLEHPWEALQSFQRAGVTEVIASTWRAGVPVLLWVSRRPEWAQARLGLPMPLSALFTSSMGPIFPLEQMVELGDKLSQVCQVEGLFETFQAELLILGGALVAQGTGWDAEQKVKTALDGGGSGARLEHFRFQPTELLATERETFAHQSLAWHGQQCSKLARPERTFFLETRARSVRLDSAEETASMLEKWETQSASGVEGVILRPADALLVPDRVSVPPAYGVQGRQALIRRHGPDFAEPHRLEVLREQDRSAERALAATQHVLLFEGLERFVAGEPLPRQRACLLASLAALSEQGKLGKPALSRV